MSNLTKPTHKVTFRTIDDWNRPVFEDERGNFFGSLDKLFKWGATEEEVLESVKAEDLVYFSRNLDDDPNGGVVQGLEIVYDQLH